MKISNEQAQIIATAIRPQIKAYLEKTRDKYEAWLQSECDKERQILCNLQMSVIQQ